MELKVWVDGIQRIVCGVTQATTCQDVVFALAHATSTTGRFTLIERWRSNERLLAPSQHPLKVLLKWGEHASDVQFILQRTSLNYKNGHNLSSRTPISPEADSPELQIDSESGQQRHLQAATRNRNHICNNNNTHGDGLSPSSNTPVGGARDIRKSLTFSGAMVSREARASGRGVPSYDSAKVEYSSAGLPDELEEAEEEESGRSPSPQGHIFPPTEPAPSVMGRQVEHIVLDNVHQDLVALVNQQRDQLTGQQIQLTKFEAEITYLEGRWREDQAKLDFAHSEMERLSLLHQKLDEELRAEDPDAEEEKLKSVIDTKERLSQEMISVRQQIHQCDAQIAHLTSNITSLEEELLSLKLANDEKLLEIGEDEDGFDFYPRDAEYSQNSTEVPSPELAKVLEEVESALAGKREQVEELKRAMMSENLEALSLTPPDRLAASLHAPTGAAAAAVCGVSRRIIGSPRMLETAVPTSKNPHGVWV
ncbi:ras association domain-containing protein 8 isoform X4 [Hyalella azteca]|uniref:Ras association domain-containing protein 8 isoform X4 n=1 Tax=Hyalella azteca TaxID=294128 RepID=A0A8B7NVM4_HYAAZ|nr:ras association domain-containing protein 8 isoform X4 [Hyalella azteca]